MDDKTVLLPIGSTECHGRLPVQTDTLIAQAFCEEVRRRFAVQVDEPIAEGFTPTTAGLAGTQSPGFEEVFHRVRDRVVTLFHQGRRYVVLVNIHNGNDSVLTAVVQDLHLQHGHRLMYFNPYRAFQQQLDADCFGDGDNGLKECSLLLASLEILSRQGPQLPDADERAERDPLVERLRRVGVVGFTYTIPAQHVAWRSAATAEAGHKYLGETARRFGDVLADLRTYVERGIDEEE